MGEALGGIYNPQAMSEPEFLTRYSVRLELTDKVLGMILGAGPEDEPEHVIVQGQRGQGKTSLLRRIQISLRDNRETRHWLIPLLFNEELYGVTSLCRLWEEAASLLSNRPGLDGLPDAMEAAWNTPHYEKDCYLILDRAIADQGARLVLLIDNIGDLFGKLKRPAQQRLREILHTTKRIQIVGASAVMIEQHYDHSAPFYQFFREVNLPGLSREEALTLLRHLGTPEQKARLNEVIQRAPGRIETLRRLTAGVPRTLVLLFEILLDRDGTAFRDLELLLDRVTPLYKHRMDDLPPQQQAIVDAVALGWDALSAGEIARATRLPSKQVAAQLKQLERANIIYCEPTSKKNNLYRLEERFFNIWYLMRHGRPGDRRRTLWLVRFLEIWCTPEELRERALGHLCMLAETRLSPEHAWLMTEALRRVGLDLDTEDRLVKATREYLPVGQQGQVAPSIAETIEQIESNVDAKYRPLFDRRRIATMGLSERLEYISSGPKLFRSVVSVLKREWPEDQLIDQVERLQVDAALATAEALESITMPKGINIYPGIVKFVASFRKSVADFREAGLRLRSRLTDQSLGLDREIWAMILHLRLHALHPELLPGALEAFDDILPNLDLDAKADQVTLVLTILLGTEQTAYVRRLFEDKEFAIYRFKDRFKPHYFALLAELGKSRDDDFKRMGPELAQTVEEIRAAVAEWRKRLSVADSKE